MLTRRSFLTLSSGGLAILIASVACRPRASATLSTPTALPAQLASPTPAPDFASAPTVAATSPTAPIAVATPAATTAPPPTGTTVPPPTGTIASAPTATLESPAQAATSAVSPTTATASGVASPTTAANSATDASTSAVGRLVRDVKVLVAQNGGRVDWSGPADLIAFSKGEAGEGTQIYTMTTDGTNQTCLTCGRAAVPQKNNDQPAWHPSGNYILFQSLDPNLAMPLPGAIAGRLTQGGAGINNNLWLMNADGSQFYQLTHITAGEASLHPHFSPDGSKVLWSWRKRSGQRASWVLALADFVVNAGVPQLANVKTYAPRESGGTFYESHGFSPDGSKIIFSASIGANTIYDLDIYTMDLATQQLTNLTNSPGVWDEHGHFSPSGKKIVWLSTRGYAFTPAANYGQTMHADYWIMNADGSNQTRLTYFNESGYPEYQGGRVISADIDWNHEGTSLIATLAVFPNGGRPTTKIVRIDLSGAQ